MDREFVWALKFPSSFGRHQPEVEFEGWHDELTRYYRFELTDAERAHLSRGPEQLYFNAAEKWGREGGFLEEFEKPKVLKLLRKYKSLDDIFITKSKLLVVSIEVKNLIEEFEAKTHQFWPIELRSADETIPSQTYFGLSVGQVFDSLLRGYGDGTDASDPKNEGFSNKYPFSREIFGEAKVWREKRVGVYALLFDREMMENFEKRGLKAQDFLKVWVT